MSKGIDANVALDLLNEVADKQTSSLDDMETMFLVEEPTFTVVLPHKATITFRSISSHGDLKTFERKRKAYAAKMIKPLKQDALLKEASSEELSQDDQGLYRQIMSTRTLEDWEAAYTIHHLCLEPGYSELDAIRMTRMGPVVSAIMVQVDANQMKATSVAWTAMIEEAKND